MAKATILVGDCRERLRELSDASVDSCVCDPPYHLTSGRNSGSRSNLEQAADKDLSKINAGQFKRMAKGFMGQTWDGGDVAFDPDTWREVWRVLKPGGHMVAFSGTRTYHRMVCAIEDAGFEIRDQLAWVYGCLDDQTSVVTQRGAMPYQETTLDDLALCYDVATGGYSYQPILERVEYEYEDTAYHLTGNNIDQVVSRNHRVIIERDGAESFAFAEACEPQIRVPILENLHGLRSALSDVGPISGSAGKNLRRGLPNKSNSETAQTPAIGRAERRVRQLRDVRSGDLETGIVDRKNQAAFLQLDMQRGGSRQGVGAPCAQGTRGVETGVRISADRTDDGIDQSGLERRPDLSQSEREIRKSADQICSLPGRFPVDGEARRLCHGASADCRDRDRSAADSRRNGSPSEPRCDCEPRSQFDVVRDEPRSQEIRAWPGHKTALVRVVPFHLKGKVWCLRVSTGAFVAVRNGVAFATGNSGFPKSHDVSKAIDKATGAVREQVLATGSLHKNRLMNDDGWSKIGDEAAMMAGNDPITDEAKQWEGWGTALKPAWEPICLARKPLVGTVAANVLQHGTGAINIDGCRIETAEVMSHGGAATTSIGYGGTKPNGFATEQNPLGRWPANILHDGSDEVLAGFPQTGAAKSGGKSTGRNFGQEYEDLFSKDRDRTGHDDDGGSAARFFYTAKTSPDERGEDNNHPTVKPKSLMSWLVRLITPPDGIVLDPFCGSGSTLVAACAGEFNAIGCELSPDYADIAERRIKRECGFLVEIARS